MAKRTKTRYVGVYRRTSPKRKNGQHPDVCYDIAYRFESRLIWEKVGWESEGYNARMAKEVRDERIHMIRHGDDLPKIIKKKIPTFAEAATRYLAWAEVNKKWGNRNDEFRYRLYLKKPLGKLRLDEVSSFHLEKIKSAMSKKGKAPSTIKAVLALVREIYNRAIEWGFYQGKNPVKGVKMPRINNKRDRYLTYEEAHNLLKEIEKLSPQTRDIALVSLHCGLRAGEIFNLKGRDINIGSGTIRITDPKNDEPRTAYMTNAVKEMFRRYMPLEPDEYVFKDTKGHKIERISNTFMRCVNRLGLNDGIKDRRYKIVFHSCRHTFASWLVIQGEPIYTVQVLLGHKTIVSTVRYAHLNADTKRQAVRVLERNFDSASSENKGTLIPLEQKREVSAS